jgi:hypothetical protein
MIKMPNNVVAFAGNNIKIYEQFVDYFNHYHKRGSYDESISLSEKEKKIDEGMRSEIARLSGVNTITGISPEQLVTHPLYKWATFAVIGTMVDAVLPDALIASTGLYTDVRVGGFGDSFAFDIKPRDLFVPSKTGRAKRHGEVRKQFEGQVTVLPEPHDITVQVSFFKVLAGKENLAEFAMKAAKGIESQATIDTFTTFNTAMEALDNAGDDLLRVAGYTQETLISLAQKVTAWNGGNKAVVVGTQLALQNVLPDDANYRYELDSAYVKIGYIPTAFGYDIMALPQVADYRTPFTLALDDDNIYILSPSAGKLIKLCLEGSTLSITDDVNANANMTQSTTMIKSYNSAVCTSSVAAIITL